MPRRRFDARLKLSKKAEVLIGVDEAGRGPLAGPLVAAAVVLPPSARGLSRVRDSKKLSPRLRAELFKTLRAKALSVSLAWAHPRRIDAGDILSESLSAMGRAAGRARRRLGIPGRRVFVAVDGNRPIPGLGMPQAPFVGGDDASLAVAAASIVAKVVRDRWMERLDRRHPGYGLARHKGYGTRLHLEAIARRGPSKAHRRSFAPVSQLPLELAR